MKCTTWQGVSNREAAATAPSSSAYEKKSCTVMRRRLSGEAPGGDSTNHSGRLLRSSGPPGSRGSRSAWKPEAGTQNHHQHAASWCPRLTCGNGERACWCCFGMVSCHTHQPGRQAAVPGVADCTVGAAAVLPASLPRRGAFPQGISCSCGGCARRRRLLLLLL